MPIKKLLILNKNRKVKTMGKMKKEKVLIAMSGGVDSSVAAYMMKKNGRECIGVTMKLYDGDYGSNEDRNVCCSREDIADARMVASKLDMPHHVLNFKDDFKEKVIDRFIAAYERGDTPNPCIYCNRYIKFAKLYKSAADTGCDHIVTGHYVRLEEKGGRMLMRKALDLNKDQSYMLYMMKQEELRHTYFPLGDMEKDETRKLAEKAGLVTAAKHDSQDICFVPDGDYASFIEHINGRKYASGNFINADGNVIGTHRGIIRYTLGQRKGLGIALGKPVFVVDKNIEENTVTLGSNDDLFSRQFEVHELNWISFDEPPEAFRAKVKVRYRQQEQLASVTVTGEDKVCVVFDEPQRAVTHGQSAVFYDGEYVLGGGIII